MRADAGSGFDFIDFQGDFETLTGMLPDPESCVVLVSDSAIRQTAPGKRLPSGDPYGSPHVIAVCDEDTFHEGTYLELTRAGCSGVIAQNSSRSTIERALRAVAVGLLFYPRRVLSRYVHDRVNAGAGSRRLSTREGEVLSLMAAGLSNKQISEQLGLSQQTVRWHVANLYAKTGIRGRVHLSAQARSNGAGTTSHGAAPATGLLPASNSALIFQEGLPVNRLSDLVDRWKGAVLLRCPAGLDDLVSCARKFEAPVVVIDSALVDQCGDAEFAAHARTSLGSRILVTVPHDIPVCRAIALLEAGCVGLISREVSPAGLRRAISAVQAGDMRIAWALLSGIVRHLVVANQQVSLSPREQAVVEQLAEGCTNKEIAARLFISVETLRWHIRNLYAKTGVRSRSELAALNEVRPGTAA